MINNQNIIKSGIIFDKIKIDEMPTIYINSDNQKNQDQIINLVLYFDLLILFISVYYYTVKRCGLS